MSIVDLISFQADSSLETKNIAISMANSLYPSSRTVYITGELGAGKTTFVQGLAEGLGITEKIVSPTYALEQQYEKKLSHIDLYRLTEKEAQDFMATLDEFSGVRVIEWPERAHLTDGGVAIGLQENGEGRRIDITCRDIDIPSEDLIKSWYEETMIQDHIVKHMHCVAEMCDLIVDALQKQKRVVRKKALRAAALCHDLLRFTDFRSFDSNGEYSTSDKEKAQWTECKELYGTPHEHAAERFLVERGFRDLGAIIRTHRGKDTGENTLPTTTEQIALMYADKRSLHDQRVSVDERFDDFVKRYGKGTETSESKEWRNKVKQAEKILFPDGNIA